MGEGPDDRHRGQDSSAFLIERYRGGDQDAAREIFDRYVNRLVVLARSRISPKLNSRIDPEDIVQSAYRSFFLRSRGGDFSVEEGGDLWRLLAAITLNKLHRQVERHMAAKRSVDRERAVDASLMRFDPELLSREPTAEEALVAADQIRKLMEDCSELNRNMLEFRLQGFTFEEIAEKVGRSERTIRRFFDRLKYQLEEEMHGS